MLPMADKRSIIGVDLGGTKADAVRYDAESLMEEARTRMETRADHSFSRVLEELAALIRSISTKETAAVGIGVPGLVLQPEGRIVRLPNIPGSEDIPLKEILTEACGLPVFLDNDANAFALAEAVLGAGRGKRVVVGITMGTGVGGGIVIEGKIFHGSRGLAAEIGHMLLVPGEPPFETEDRRGDVEQFLSGTALGKRCKHARDPSEYLEGETCAFLFPELERETAWMCASLTHLLDPDAIIFGGKAGRAFASRLPNVSRELLKWLLPGTPAPALLAARLPDAETKGAALLASSARSK